MRLRVFAWVLLLLPVIGVLLRTDVRAEEDATICQEQIATTNTIGPAPNPSYVNATAHTSRSGTAAYLCGGTLKTEYWITGFSAFSPGSDYVDAWSGGSQLANCGQAYTGNSKHWWQRYVWYDMGAKMADTTMPACSGGGDGGGGGSGGNDGCPLVVDLTGQGFHLTGLKGGVWFDLANTGTLQRVSWTASDSDNAWLVMDRNGDGRINSGAELFGNYTPAYFGHPLPTAANGFDALKFIENPEYAAPGGVPDGNIDAKDPAYPRLMLWTDRNQNGISEPDEIVPAWKAGLISISLDYRLTRRRDRHGNEFRQKARSVWQLEDDTLTTRPIYDVWLRMENETKSRPSGTWDGTER
jgi:hypothetical protein